MEEAAAAVPGAPHEAGLRAPLGPLPHQVGHRLTLRGLAIRQAGRKACNEPSSRRGIRNVPFLPASDLVARRREAMGVGGVAVLARDPHAGRWHGAQGVGVAAGRETVPDVGPRCTGETSGGGEGGGEVWS